MNLVEEIQKLKKEKNAVIMAHFYQRSEIQDIADYVGDSLALAQWAASTNANTVANFVPLAVLTLLVRPLMTAFDCIFVSSAAND